MTPSPLIVGNWKMNGCAADLEEAAALVAGISGISARVGICPPATLIERLANLARGTALEVGGQDCRAERSGAFTGDVSAEMLTDAGATLVILGHSERRAGYGETSALVAAKVTAALRTGLEPIVCVGETLEQRNSGNALRVVTEQVANSLPPELAGKAFSLAYEPVWAIGTGLTASIAQIEEMHLAIRESLIGLFGDQGRASPILYGGSVKAANAMEILSAAEVGGALVGGASLKAADFLAIIHAA